MSADHTSASRAIDPDREPKEADVAGERCPICGGTLEGRFPALPLAGRTLFRYVRCGQCGLARLDEKRSPDELRKLYETVYELTSAEFTSGRESLLSRVRELNFRLIARRIETLTPPGQLLDIGTGAGVFLAVMRRRGWQVAGLEPHRESARGLREVHGFDVREGTLEEAPEDWGPFDVVTMLDVIEHLPDPAAALAQAGRLLRPGGVLVLTTPNVTALEHRLFGRHWFALQPPDHLWLFSPESLKLLVTAAGFSGVTLANSPVSYAWTSLRRKFGISPLPDPVDAALKALAALPMGPIGMLSAAPANLELYARRSSGTA